MTFTATVMLLMTTLMNDFGLTDFQAAGVVGNLGHESEGFTILHEIGQRPGSGGYGWGQWTGSRRRAFLWWCETHHLDWRSDEANLSYMTHELDGAYHEAVLAVARSATIDAATTVFEKVFERAGVPALQSRLEWARAALDAYRAAQPKAAWRAALAAARSTPSP